MIKSVNNCHRVVVNTTCLSVTRSHGSLVVKVADSCPACHEFEPSTAEDPSCRECRLNLSWKTELKGLLVG
ncbi:hypothetical protein TNCV_4266771 [Trichonephila clavipes]|nr:hypothetical protein TNCV_4266771 [Trichonephila clavipes]